MPGRLASAVTLASAAAVGLSIAVALFATASAGGASAHRYVDPLGWSLSYPSGMYLEHAQSPRYIEFDEFEVTVASFPMRDPIRAGSSGGSAWMHLDPPRNPEGLFPADGVAFRVIRSEGGPGPNNTGPPVV